MKLLTLNSCIVDSDMAKEWKKELNNLFTRYDDENIVKLAEAIQQATPEIDNNSVVTQIYSGGEDDSALHIEINKAADSAWGITEDISDADDIVVYYLDGNINAVLVLKDGDCYKALFTVV